MTTTEVGRRPGPPAGGPPRGGPPPAAILLSIANGYVRTQLLGVAARLGLADHLADGPRGADELAAAAGADPGGLRRVLRALASFGVFAEEPDGRFALTDLAQALRTGAPGSVRHVLAFFAQEDNYRAVGDLLHSVRTGEVAFDHLYGQPFYGWLAARPEEAEVFGRAMEELSALEVGEVVDSYDFSGLTTLVDVGGGSGRFLGGILQRTPGLRGVLVDLPQAVRRAPEVLARLGVADRCEVVGRDLLDGVPAGHDGYLLKRVLHNWDDAMAGRILASCRAAMSSPASRLIVVDQVVPERVQPSPLTEAMLLMDTLMLAKHGGRQRGRSEFEALLAGADLRLTDAVAGAARFAVLEAVARE